MTEDEIRAKRSASAKKAAATRAAKKLIAEAKKARTTYRHYAVRGKLARHLLGSVAFPRILGPMMRPANAQIHTYRMER